MAFDGIPTATVGIVPNGLGLIQLSPEKIVAIFGCCSDGDELVPAPFSNSDDLVAARGTGPSVKAAAYLMAKTGCSVVHTRLPKTAVTASLSAVNVDDVDGTAVPTVSGTPLDFAEVSVVITTGGTIGTSFSYKLSLDGGENYGDIVNVTTATTIVITDLGVTINLTGTQTFVTDDEFTFSANPGSEAILPVTITRVETSTSEATVTGEPEDWYDVVIEFLEGGEVGTPGIVYRYSLDGGDTWTAATQLSDETDFDLIDDKKGGELSSGINVEFDDGETWDTGDKITFKTTGPEWQESDGEEGLDFLRASANAWSFPWFVGPCDLDTAGALGAKLDEYERDPNDTKFGGMVVTEMRDRPPQEPKLLWKTRLIDEAADFDDDRVSPWAGFAKVSCPITGRNNRRSCAWALVPRVVANDIDVDPGQKSLGPLSSDVDIHDDENNTVEWDSRLDASLHNAGYGTLRTWGGEPGVYITRGNIMTETDFNRIAYRRVADRGAEVQMRVERQQAEAGFAVNPPGVANPGCVRPIDANRIEREIRTALQSEIGTKVSGISVQVNRTTPVMQVTGRGKLKIDTKVVPKVYIDDVEGSFGFINPSSLAIQTP